MRSLQIHGSAAAEEAQAGCVQDRAPVGLRGLCRHSGGGGAGAGVPRAGRPVCKGVNIIKIADGDTFCALVLIAVSSRLRAEAHGRTRRRPLDVDRRA